ncbi:MAG: hypothetical protein IPI23_12660 [Bacteroidetes bacterium]|nr:hypothetical protein [Bacteroidota bacterium]
MLKIITYEKLPTTIHHGYVFVVCDRQTIDKKWNIGFHGGAEQYNGDLGNGFYKTDLPFYGFGGVSFSRYLGVMLI